MVSTTDGCLTRRSVFSTLSMCLLPTRLIAEAGQINSSTSAGDDLEIARLLEAAIVSFQPGRRYKINRTIVIPSDRILQGNGSSLEMMGPGPAIMIHGSSRVAIDNLSIISNGEGFDGNHGIFVDWRGGKFDTVRLTNLRIAGFGDSGITVLGSSEGSRGIRIESCFVSHTGGHGIIIQDFVSDVAVVGNRVSNPGLRIRDRPAITASRFGTNVSILNNICSADERSIGSSCHGISLDRTNKFNCSGNSVLGFRSGFGVEVGGAADGVVENNSISQCGHGIAFSGFNDGYRCSDVTIVRNVLRDCVSSGLHSFITGCDGEFLHQRLSLIANDVVNSAGSSVENGIFLMDAKDVSIKDCKLNGFRKAAVYLVDCLNVDISNIALSRSLLSVQTPNNLVVRWRAIRPLNRRAPTLKAKAFMGSDLRPDVQS